MSATLQNTIFPNWESHRSGEDLRDGQAQPIHITDKGTIYFFLLLRSVSEPQLYFSALRGWAAHPLCLECEWVIRRSLSLERSVAGTQVLCIWESKGLIMLSQEKPLANNNSWAASEFRTWNPASWNDHKGCRRKTALPLRSQAWQGCQDNRMHETKPSRTQTVKNVQGRPRSQAWRNWL